jgi:threonine/homoserine/homoserine lactone efflux protein
MDLFLFMGGTAALLATPGPTNTLLAASGAALGARRALKLLPAELAGYLASIGAATLLLGPVLAAGTAAATVLKLAAAAWLVSSAAMLWRKSASQLAPVPADGIRVFTTTLLNPKALIFATLIFPPEAFARGAMAFAPLCLGFGAAWTLTGATLLRDRVGPRTICRTTAVAQIAFAGVAAVSAL